MYTAQEDFVAFLPTRDTTGETLSNMILTKIAQWGLDPANIVGQGYDGVHCKNHCLNLAINHTCKQRIVANTFTALREVLYFLTSSPKQLQALDPVDHACSVCVKRGGFSMQSV